MCYGTFKTKELAGIQYDRAALYHYGEFARVNYPERIEKTKTEFYLLFEKRRMHTNTSGYAGVHFATRYQKWIATASSKHLGRFKTKEEAIECRKQWEQSQNNC